MNDLICGYRSLQTSLRRLERRCSSVSGVVDADANFYFNRRHPKSLDVQIEFEKLVGRRSQRLVNKSSTQSTVSGSLEVQNGGENHLFDLPKGRINVTPTDGRADRKSGPVRIQ